MSFPNYINSLIDSNPQFKDMFAYQSHGAFADAKEKAASEERIADLPTPDELLNLSLDKEIEKTVRNSYNEKIVSVSLNALSHDNPNTFEASRNLSSLVENETNLENCDQLQNCVLHRHNFTNWTLARQLCSDDKVEWNIETLYNQNAHKITCNPNKAFDKTSAERDLLTYLFYETFKNQTASEKRDLIALKNQHFPTTSTSLKIKSQVDFNNKVWRLAEKVVNCAAKIVSSPAFQIAVAIGAGYASHVMLSKIAYVAKDLAIFHGLPKLINHAPLSVIKTINFIQSNMFEIWFASSVFKWISPPGLLKDWVFAPISTVTGVFSSIGAFIGRLAFLSARKCLSKSKQLGAKAEDFQKKYHDLQLGYEFVETRERWIDHIINERNAYRSKFAVE